MVGLVACRGMRPGPPNPTGEQHLAGSGCPEADGTRDAERAAVGGQLHIPAPLVGREVTPGQAGIGLNFANLPLPKTTVEHGAGAGKGPCT